VVAVSKRFSASSAAQLMQCPGSANLELAIPGYVAPVVDPMKGAKGLGTSVHAAIEYILNLSDDEFPEVFQILEIYMELGWRKRRAIAASRKAIQTWLDELVAAGLWIPDHSVKIIKFLRLIEPAQFAPASLRFIHETVAKIVYIRGNLPNGDAWSELQMTAGWLPSRPGTTADYIICNHEEVYIFDVKNGKIPVYAEGNKQLLFYLRSFLFWLDVRPGHFKKMIVIIMQPGNESYWEVSLEELLHFEEQAILADQKILRKDLTLRPGDHCTFCPANPHSRGDKGSKMCPVMMTMLYPPVIDEDEILEM
jgi:hypothetical protein